MMKDKAEKPARVASTYDVAEYLETEDDIAAYLDAARKTGDPRLLEAAMDDVVRACSRMRRARDTQHTDALHSDS